MNNALFDYKTASRNMQIPPEIMRSLEIQAQQEFPNDAMLMELHVLRALKAYARKGCQEVQN